MVHSIWLGVPKWLYELIDNQSGKLAAHICPLPPQKRRAVLPGALAHDCCMASAPVVPVPAAAPIGLWIEQRSMFVPMAARVE